LVETADGLDSLGLDEVEHLLAERLKLLVVGNRLGLTADRDHRAAGAVGRQAVADEPFGRRPVGALRRVRHPLFAQEDDRGLHVAVRLLQRALAVHHSRARALAELADELSRDLRRHQASSVPAFVGSPSAASERLVSSAPSFAGSSPVGTGTLSPSVTGSICAPAATCSTSPSGTLSGAGVSSASCCCSSCAETFCFPSFTASASAWTIRLHERIASSLPGMT